MTAAQSPNLQLPPRPPSRPTGAGHALLYVLIVIVLALQGWSMLRSPATSSSASAPDGSSATAERELAMKLEDRNLPDAAAAAWASYLAGTSLEPAERAAVYFRIGKLHEQARRYEQAVDAFYRAERFLGDADADLSRQITLHVADCLRKLGQYADLSRETAERAGAISGESDSLAGRQVVAEIGGERISVAEFDRQLTEQIEQMIAAQVGIGPDQAEAMRQQAHAQFRDPQAKAQQLQQMIAERVLAAEARRRGLEKSDAFVRQMTDFADRLLAARLMVDEIGSRATVTPEDVERFFQANRERYDEPAKIRIAHIVCDSEDTALDVIIKSQSGESFGELAKQYSSDETTKDDGGVIAEPVSGRGTFVPGVGDDELLHTAVMNGDKDKVLGEPYQSRAGWHVVKVVDLTESKPRPLEEVREAVERDTRSARRAEVTQQYVQELFDAQAVKFYPNAFGVGEPGEEPSDES